MCEDNYNILVLEELHVINNFHSIVRMFNKGYEAIGACRE